MLHDAATRSQSANAQKRVRAYARRRRPSHTSKINTTVQADHLGVYHFNAENTTLRYFQAKMSSKHNRSTHVAIEDIPKT